MIALPSFAPKAEANEGLALAKSDRLAVRSPPQNCFKQTWPDSPPLVCATAVRKQRL
jgi:hypothetical protein